MYNETRVRRHTLEKFELLETELERPIRILHGGARAFPLDRLTWTTDQAQACNTPLVECESKGLTFIDWSTLHDERALREVQLPAATWLEEGRVYADQPVYIYDLMSPPDRFYVSRPINIEDFTIGEVAERVICLYIPWNTLDYPQAYGTIDFSENGWLRHAIDVSLDEELAAELRDARATYNRERYRDYVRILSDDGVNGIRNEVQNLTLTSETARRQLAVAEHDLKDKNKMLQTLLTELDQERDFDLDEEWDRLVQDERILSLDFSGPETIVLQTKGVTLTHPHDDERTADLGPFRWTLNMSTAEITVENTGNARGGYDHPHVQHQRPCFGEMGSTIYTMLRAGQLAGAIEMVFLFLGTIQLRDDWSRRAAFWFDDENADARMPQAIEWVDPADLDEDWDDEDPEEYDDAMREAAAIREDLVEGMIE